MVELVAADVERPGAADGSTGSGISKFLIFRDIQAMSWPVGSLRWMKPAATAFWRRGFPPRLSITGIEPGLTLG